LNEAELIRFIESRGFEFLSLVEWRKSFRVRYQTESYRMALHLKIPLSTIPATNDGSDLWFDFAKAIGRTENSP